MAVVLAISLSGQASAATKEIVLASPAAALKYCQSGKMPSSDIDYIAGAAALAQYGPGQNCIQQAAAVDTVKKALQQSGKRVSACNLANAKAAITFCESGAMGEYDIAYIGGKVGKTISGPGYGCVVNFSTSGIGNALCK
jgi:hypothetical protein